MTGSGNKALEDEEEELTVPIPPDGGWGWVIVIASLFSNVIVDGVCFSFGIFFMEFMDYFKGSSSKTALIGSLIPGMYLGMGPVAAALANQFGCRPVAIAGSIVASVGFILSTFSPSLDILILTYGIIGGAGFGLMFYPPVLLVNSYFDKKRSMAAGILTAGSGIGGIAVPPLVKILIREYGWKGCNFILAGIILNGIPIGATLRELWLEKEHKSLTTRRNSCKELCITQEPSEKLSAILELSSDQLSCDQLSFIELSSDELSSGKGGSSPRTLVVLSEHSMDKINLTEMPLKHSHCRPCVDVVEQSPENEVPLLPLELTTISATREGSGNVGKVPPDQMEETKNLLREQLPHLTKTSMINSNKIEDQLHAAEISTEKMPSLRKSTLDSIQESDHKHCHEQKPTNINNNGNSCTDYYYFDFVTSKQFVDKQRTAKADNGSSGKQSSKKQENNVSPLNKNHRNGKRKRNSMDFKHSISSLPTGNQAVHPNVESPIPGPSNKSAESSKSRNLNSFETAPMSLRNSDSHRNADFDRQQKTTEQISGTNPFKRRSSPYCYVLTPLQSATQTAQKSFEKRQGFSLASMSSQSPWEATEVRSSKRTFHFDDYRVEVKRPVANSSLMTKFMRALLCRIDIRLFKSLTFLFFFASSFMNALGYHAPIFYVTDYATTIKAVDSSTKVPLVSLIAIGSLIGRFSAGFLADFAIVNSILFQGFLHFISGIFAFFIPLCNSYPKLAVLCFLYGSASGGSVTLISPVLVNLFGLAMLSHSFGLNLLAISAGVMIGPVIFGVFYEWQREYRYCFWAGSAVMIASSFLVIVTKFTIKREKNTFLHTKHQQKEESKGQHKETIEDDK